MNTEERIIAAITALDKDVAVRMAKLQLLGYNFNMTQSPRIVGNIWVDVQYPNGARMQGAGGHIRSLTDIVLRVWNNHVEINTKR